MEEIKKDELFDEELRGMVKFTDATTTTEGHKEPSKNKSNKRKPAEERKTAQKPIGEPVDAEYEPVGSPHGERFFNCIKWPAFFICLEYLIFYWQQTGQMQDSAAVPSMIACALFAGLNIGKNWGLKEWRKAK